MKLQKMLSNRTKNRKNSNAVSFVCSKCGATWKSTVGEICWFHEIGNVVPTLCKECRAEKKQQRREAYKKKYNDELNKETITEEIEINTDLNSTSTTKRAYTQVHTLNIEDSTQNKNTDEK